MTMLAGGTEKDHEVYEDSRHQGRDLKPESTKYNITTNVIVKIIIIIVNIITITIIITTTSIIITIKTAQFGVALKL
jgi:hypothetical protein